MPTCPHDDYYWSCPVCQAVPAADPDYAFVFAAKFEGMCVGCGFDIKVGERIQRESDGSYSHEGC